jgi:Glycosyl hydrolase family 26
VVSSRGGIVAIVGLLVSALGACGGESGASDGETAPAGAEPSSTTVPVESSCAPPVVDPAPGTRYFGVNLDWSTDTPDAFADRLGVGARVFVRFAQFPMADEQQWVDAAVDMIAEQGGMLLLTLEPHGGLKTVTPESAADLASVVRGYEEQGVPVIIRFAHEMNGSWYPWAQRPAEYVRTYRMLADAVRRGSPDSAMLWAPNYGGGYPFPGGKFAAVPGTNGAARLDTNGDGTITMTDDPYAPFYPGDEYVDWVGMTIYHWGAVYPWGENEMPEPNKFAEQLTGTYDGTAGDETSVPDFYDEYAEARRQPMAITETAALYSPGQPGPSARRIKTAWIDEVFASATLARFDRLAMVNWFDFDKHETETAGRIDWTASRDPAVASALRAALTTFDTCP